jgi:hypothetical protein
MMSAPRTPGDRRAEAAGQIVEDFARQDNGWIVSEADRVEIVTRIVALRPMGRTARWQRAVDAWATTVTQVDAGSLNWAVKQYMIYAVHAAQ